MRAALPSGDRIVAEAGSRFDVESVAPDARVVRVDEGTVLFDVKPLTEGERFEVEVPSHAIPGKLVEELWEHFVKGGLERPTFVMDFPVDTSPLVREHLPVGVATSLGVFLVALGAFWSHIRAALLSFLSGVLPLDRLPPSH